MMWQRDTSGECSDEDEGSATITDVSTSYDIMGLEADSNYSITVTATNVAGSSAVSDAVTAVTVEAGEIWYWSCPIEVNKVFLTYMNSSVCCSHFCECI